MPSGSAPRLALVLLLASLALPAGAMARPTRVVGHSTLALTGPGGKAIGAAGVVAAPIAPATVADNGTFRFPVATGFGNTTTFDGVLVHHGGLRLFKGKRAVRLTRLVALRRGRRAALWADVGGRPAGCAALSSSLRGFGTRRVVFSTFASVRRICRRHRFIRLGTLTQLRRSVANGTAHLSAELRLSRVAARIVNRVAARHVVSPTSRLGPVRSVLCLSRPCPRPAPVPQKTTLGIFTPFVTGAVGPPQIITEANALGVNTVRYSQQVSAPPRPDLNAFARGGKQVVLTINRGKNPAHPPASPAELATYRSQLDSLLAAIPTSTVPVLQIENEELVPRFLDGTATQYIDELNAAVDAGHAHGFKVTNGGIVRQPLELMVWQDYVNRGMTTEADAFAARAFRDKPAIVHDLQAKPFAGLHNQVLQAAWDKLKIMMPAFRVSRMDYVNFHWYEDDDSLLTTVVRYLERATGKPVVTTELGQHNTTPSVVTGHLTTAIDELHLPLVLWFDADGIPALGLHDAPGVLRPNGLAFKNYVLSHRSLLN